MELLRKKDSRFYWYDFKVRGKWYRGSTKETNKKRAGRIAALRFSQPAGALDPVQRLGRISRSGEQDKKILRKWLATVVQHIHRGHAS